MTKKEAILRVLTRKDRCTEYGVYLTPGGIDAMPASSATPVDELLLSGGELDSLECNGLYPGDDGYNYEAAADWADRKFPLRNEGRAGDAFGANS